MNEISVCFIFKYKLSYRRSSVKGQSITNGTYLCLRCTSNGNRIEASEGVSHYQQPNVMKEENTYQTTSLQ